MYCEFLKYDKFFFSKKIIVDYDIQFFAASLKLKYSLFREFNSMEIDEIC